jgi:hypothetical protein
MENDGFSLPGFFSDQVFFLFVYPEVCCQHLAYPTKPVFHRDFLDTKSKEDTTSVETIIC